MHVLDLALNNGVPTQRTQQAAPVIQGCSPRSIFPELARKRLHDLDAAPLHIGPFTKCYM